MRLELVIGPVKRCVTYFTAIDTFAVRIDIFA